MTYVKIMRANEISGTESRPMVYLVVLTTQLVQPNDVNGLWLELWANLLVTGRAKWATVTFLERIASQS